MKGNFIAFSDNVDAWRPHLEPIGAMVTNWQDIADEMLRRTHDPAADLDEFLREMMVPDEKESVLSAEAYGAYSAWAESRDLPTMSLTRFGLLMKKRYEWRHTNRANAYLGIRL